jgi:steroid delta-isomerase-like uncharacterized protein
MQAHEMDAVIKTHIEAEMAGDTAGAVSMYAEDVEHDVVGWPAGPLHGPDAAKGFYDQLVADFNNEEMVPTRSLYGEDFCVIEHACTGTVPGSFLGIPGHGRRVTFRMLHVWEFSHGRISRENVWLDGGSVAAQLTQAA